MSPLWSGWFAAGVLRFGLSPAAFWSLTLAEWRALTAAGARAGAQPMSRGELDTLLATHGGMDERQDA